MKTFLFLIVSVVFVIISVSIDGFRGFFSKLTLSFLMIVLACYAVGKLLYGYEWMLPIANKLCIGLMAVAILNIIITIFRRK